MSIAYTPLGQVAICAELYCRHYGENQIDDQHPENDALNSVIIPYVYTLHTDPGKHLTSFIQIQTIQTIFAMDTSISVLLRYTIIARITEREGEG